jgi:hypothetical protein
MAAVGLKNVFLPLRRCNALQVMDRKGFAVKRERNGKDFRADAADAS